MIAVAAPKPAPLSAQVIVSVVVGGDADADALTKPQVAVVAPPVQLMESSLEKYPGGVVRTTLPLLGTALTVVNPNANQPAVGAN